MNGDPPEPDSEQLQRIQEIIEEERANRRQESARQPVAIGIVGSGLNSVVEST